MAESQSITKTQLTQPQPFWDAICMLLPKGEHTVIDVDYFEEFIRHRWFVASIGPSRSGLPAKYKRVVRNKSGGGLAYLHREVMNCPKGLVVDHIHHNLMDNRKSELRICTRSQNNMNSLKKRRMKTPYKGVYWSEACQCWVCFMGPRSMPNSERYLGQFSCPIEAAKAYNRRALELYGEFAYLNAIPLEEGGFAG